MRKKTAHTAHTKDLGAGHFHTARRGQRRIYLSKEISSLYSSSLTSSSKINAATPDVPASGCMCGIQRVQLALLRVSLNKSRASDTQRKIDQKCSHSTLSCEWMLVHCCSLSSSPCSVPLYDFGWQLSCNRRSCAATAHIPASGCIYGIAACQASFALNPSETIWVPDAQHSIKNTAMMLLARCRHAAPKRVAQVR